MQARWFPALAAVAILAASTARAQSVDPPRVEIGGDFSAVIPIVFTDGPRIVAGAGPRLALNLTPRIGIEGLADILGGLETSGTTVLYQTQLKLRGRRRAGRATVAFTVGAAGAAWYRHVPETRVPRLDGSIAVYPGYRRLQVEPPSTLCAGVTREQVFGRNASSHLALQGYVGALGGIALRMSAGVSFAIGGYR